MPLSPRVQRSPHAPSRFTRPPRRADAHAALSANRTPTLILRGECDYIASRVAAAYKNTLPNATLVVVPRAGHRMYYEQPEWYLAVVRAFLLEQPLPLETDSAPPMVGEGRLAAWSSTERNRLQPGQQWSSYCEATFSHRYRLFSSLARLL